MIDGITILSESVFRGRWQGGQMIKYKGYIKNDGSEFEFEVDDNATSADVASRFIEEAMSQSDIGYWREEDE